jgi:hypothetical protein
MYKETSGNVLTTEKNAVRFENYLRAEAGETKMRSHYGGYKIDFTSHSVNYFKKFNFPLRRSHYNARIEAAPNGILKDNTTVRKEMMMTYDSRAQKFVFR